MRRAAELGTGEQGLIERIARAAECRQQLDAARLRAEVARELAYLLGANILQTYLVRDAMRVLVEDGSLHLQRLSDGRYTLQADDLDFQVVDRWNGDAVRSVKTLSGGERSSRRWPWRWRSPSGSRTLPPAATATRRGKPVR